MKAISSGKVVDSAMVFPGPCFYLGISASATFDVWDSETSTTTNDIQVDYDPAAACHVLNPIWCAKGIYVAITGSFIVWYAL